MRGCFTLVGLALLVIGIASVAILIKIGGKSDGPGALVFYIGAAGGLFGGLVVLSSLRTKE
jgi:hypothetical protein